MNGPTRTRHIHHLAVFLFTEEDISSAVLIVSRFL